MQKAAFPSWLCSRRCPPSIYLLISHFAGNGGEAVPDARGQVHVNRLIVYEILGVCPSLIYHFHAVMQAMEKKPFPTRVDTYQGMSHGFTTRPHFSGDAQEDEVCSWQHACRFCFGTGHFELAHISNCITRQR